MNLRDLAGCFRSHIGSQGPREGGARAGHCPLRGGGRPVSEMSKEGTWSSDSLPAKESSSQEVGQNGQVEGDLWKYRFSQVAGRAMEGSAGCSPLTLFLLPPQFLPCCYLALPYSPLLGMVLLLPSLWNTHCMLWVSAVLSLLAGGIPDPSRAG